VRQYPPHPLQRGLVKVAPSWEGRGVWLFDSEDGLAEILSRVFQGSAGPQNHCLVQDFVEGVVVEIRLHLLKGVVAGISHTRCKAKPGCPVQSSFGGRCADGEWAAAEYLEGESRDQIIFHCFAGRHADLDLAESRCRCLVEVWRGFLLADCAEFPPYVRFDFLVVPPVPGSHGGPEVWTGEITELGGQMC
ncbi:unnamed protein product, partial [Polarella glacialis]